MDPKVPEKIAVLYEVPTGTPLIEATLPEAKQFDAGPYKEVYRFKLKDKDGEEFEVEVPRGEGIEIRSATEVPTKYKSFDESGLTVTVEDVPIFTTDRDPYYEGYSFQLE